MAAFLEGCDEFSTQNILASGRWGCRVASHASHGGVHSPIRRGPCASSFPIAAGGGLDITTRLMGQWLSERLGQQFVVENRPGGGSNIGTEAVARAPADGYTLLAVAHPQCGQRDALRQAQLQFHPRHRSGRGHRARVQHYVRPSIGSGTDHRGTCRLCQSQSRQDQHGLGRQWDLVHMAGELFKLMAGIDMVHVPYRGQGAALPDLLADRCRSCLQTTPGTTEFAATGKLRALAVTTAARAEALPDVPTVADTLPGFESSNCYGVGARPATRLPE